MAEIRPLRAWRYHPDHTNQIETLTSPLFDVVSARQRERLYQNPLNSIHLSVPAEADPHAAAAARLRRWKEEGVLVQDALPTFYAYYQYFSLPGRQRPYCRKGFITNIRAYDWDENVVLRHENTIPPAVDDRVALLSETLLNVSPTHGLYTDPTHALEPYLDEAIRAPLYETEDYQGVRDVLAPVQDARAIRHFVATLSDKAVILADGHHRYEGSLAYRRRRAADDPHPTGQEPYHYHLMYLTNTESDDLVILPTHRLLADLPDFDADTLLKKLAEHFTVRPLADPYDVPEIIAGKPGAFGLLLRDRYYKIMLHPEHLDAVPWHFPDVVRELDLTRLHYFVFERALGIPGRAQRRSPHLHFERRFGECLARVEDGTAQAALITNAVTIDDVKRVCHSGATLPQKSTYFYPKVICGYLFSSIADDEFTSLADPCLA